MPTHDYKCDCGKRIEAKHPPLCCGKQMKRVWSAPAIHVQGGTTPKR